LLDEGVIYGVTTGYGDSCLVEIPMHQVNELPLQLSRFHGCGLGENLDLITARAVVVTRLCSLARGYSGVSLSLLERLIWMLNENIIPVIPSEGSVGASGDLRHCLISQGHWWVSVMYTHKARLCRLLRFMLRKVYSL
jgi:histidine ammonia-lyase